MPRAFRLGPWHIDTLQQLATAGERTASLSANESALLDYLEQHADQGPISRDTLLVEVFEYAPGIRSRAVDMALTRLRRKLEDDPTEPRWICARRGVGLYLEGLGGGAIEAPDPAPPGREDLVDDVRAALARGTVVSLVGPSGIGKSRVAEYLSDTQQGTWVPLFNQHDADGLVGAVAAALGCSPEQVGDWLDTVELLVLDNFEQLDEASAVQVQDWSSRCPMLVTSIRPLRIDTERVVPVPDLQTDVALQLLRDHAERAGVPVVDADLTATVDRVGGHPLALILLAPSLGLVPHLPASSLLDLDSERPDHPARHRTLHAALARALDLVSDEARQVLADLSQLALSFELRAVQAICGPAGVLALRELLRWGLVQKRGSLYQLPPVVALQARRLERSPGAQGRYHVFLLGLAEHSFIHGQTRGTSPYLDDVIRAVGQVDDERLYELAVVGANLGAPPKPLRTAIARRDPDVPHADALFALSIVMEFRDPARERLRTMEPTDPMIRYVQLGLQWHDGDQTTPLTAEEFRSLRGRGHPLSWPSMVIGLSVYLEPDDALRLLDEEARIAEEDGRHALVELLRASQAQAMFRLGQYGHAFAVLREIDADRLTMIHSIYLIAAACALDAMGVARTAVEQLDARAERIGWAPNIFRTRVLRAVVAYLCGEPALDAANQALNTPGGSASPRWGALALFVLRLETGSTESVGDDMLDRALAGEVPPPGGRTIATLARLMLRRRQGARS